MSEIGIRSEQTAYRILDQAGVPRRPIKKSVMKVTAYLDDEAAAVVRKLNPKNLSEFISEAIKNSVK